MLSTDALADFEQSVSVLTIERNRLLPKRYSEILAKASAVGALGSGNTLLQMMQATIDDFELRAGAVMREFVNAVSAHDHVLKTDDVNPSYERIRHEICGSRDDLRATLLSQRQFQSSATGGAPGDAAVAAIKQRYDEATFIVTAKQEIEIRRELAKLTKQPPGGQGPMNFYGPVGAIISGDKNSTEVNQTFNAGGVAALSEALQTVIEKLAEFTPAESQKEQLAELMDLAQEAKAEADKPQPNKLKLISIVQAVGAAVGLIENIPGAYGALKVGAAHIGVILP